MHCVLRERDVYVICMLSNHCTLVRLRDMAARRLEAASRIPVVVGSDPVDDDCDRDTHKRARTSVWCMVKWAVVALLYTQRRGHLRTQSSNLLPLNWPGGDHYMASHQFLPFKSGHNDFVHDVAYDYYGKRLASCSSDRRIKVWGQGEDGEWEEQSDWEAHRGSVWKLAWAHSEFGQVIASCTFDRTVGSVESGSVDSLLIGFPRGALYETIS